MRAGLNVLKYIAVFITTVAAAAALLVAAALIPRDAIRNNMTESAEFLRDGELFGVLFLGVVGCFFVCFVVLHINMIAGIRLNRL